MKDLSDACTEIENSLPLWVGADLEPAAQQEVEEHLARCTRCAEKAAAAGLSRTRLLEGLELERRSIGDGPDPWLAIRATLRAEGRLTGRRERMAFGGRTAIGGRVPFGAARRAFPLRTAAAAAVLFGLVVAWTRLSPAPPTSVAPDLSASQLHPSPALSAPTDSAPVAGQSPVAVQSVGLRHLQPGEHLLRDSAQFFDPILSEDGTAGGRSRYEGSPVGLERRLTVPPR